MKRFKKKILIFGTGGLLGKYICSNLKKEKISFCSFSRSNKNKKHNYFDLNYKPSSKILLSIKKFDLIIFNAAFLPNKKNLSKNYFLKINTLFLKKIIKIAKKHNVKIIYISGILTNNIDLIKKKKIFNKENVYYLQSKLAAEKIIINKLSKKFFLILKTSSLYGSYMDKNKILFKIANNKITNPENLDNKILYNFVHADDFARYIIFSIKQNYNGIKVYASKNNFTLRSIYNFYNKGKYLKKSKTSIKLYSFSAKSLISSKFANKISIKRGLILLKRNKKNG